MKKFISKCSVCIVNIISIVRGRQNTADERNRQSANDHAIRPQKFASSMNLVLTENIMLILFQAPVNQKKNFIPSRQ
jgi:hypothetical protein